jgi:uncharacterized membrane protein HdeD (DUF308 family)
MCKSIHIAGETKVLTFANDLIALAGLLVLGFPVTSATVKTTVVGWALLMIATMQLVRRYLTPPMRFQEIRRESN